MRRLVLLSLVLWGVAVGAPAAGEVPVILPAATQPRGVFDLDSMGFFEPLPGGHKALAQSYVRTLDVGRWGVETWRWWLGGVLGAVWLWTGWRARGLWRRARRRGAAPMGAECCGKCDYCLTGVASASCPECGAALTAGNRVVARPVRWRGVRLGIYLAVLPGVFFLLRHTEPRWSGVVGRRLSWHSAAGMRVAEKLGLGPRLARWTQDDPALVEVDVATGEQTRRVVSMPEKVFGQEEPDDNLDSGGSVTGYGPILILSEDGSKAIWLSNLTSDMRKPHHVLIDLRTGRELPLADNCQQMLRDYELGSGLMLDSDSLVFEHRDGMLMQRFGLGNGALLNVVRPGERRYGNFELEDGPRLAGANHIVSLLAGRDMSSSSTVEVEAVAIDPETGKAKDIQWFSFPYVYDHVTGGGRLYTVGPRDMTLGAKEAYAAAALAEPWLRAWEMKTGKMIAGWPIASGSQVWPCTDRVVLIHRGGKMGWNVHPEESEWIEARDVMDGRVLGVMKLPGKIKADGARITGDREWLLVRCEGFGEKAQGSGLLRFDLREIWKGNQPGWQ